MAIGAGWWCFPACLLARLCCLLPAAVWLVSQRWCPVVCPVVPAAFCLACCLSLCCLSVLPCVLLAACVACCLSVLLAACLSYCLLPVLPAICCLCCLLLSACLFAGVCVEVGPDTKLPLTRRSRRHPLTSHPHHEPPPSYECRLPCWTKRAPHARGGSRQGPHAQL